MDSKQLVGQRIKAARLKAKLTQAKLASKCDMSADWVCHIERGHRRAELGTLMKLCHALKVELPAIVGSPNHNNHKPTKKHANVPKSKKRSGQNGQADSLNLRQSQAAS